MNIITKSFQLAFDSLLNRKLIIDQARPAQASGFGGYVSKVRRRRQINRGIRELSDLSNDVLKDIGIERGNIPTLVEELTDQSLNKSRAQRQVDRSESRHGYSVEGAAA